MDRRQTINNYLGNRGLATLDNPGGLCQQLGFLVEGHDQFKQLLNKCEPSERRNMYEALRPHLSFEARPLDSYLSELALEAEIQQLPTVGSDGQLHPFHVQDIRTKDAIADVVEETLATVHLTLTCKKCTKEESFHGGRRADVIFKAREAGWTYDPKNGGSEICPDCPASRN